MKALFPYAETTRRVTVRVSVAFLPEQSDARRSRWFWAYHIRLENDGPTAVQLISRQWIITDAAGRVNEVEGEGVVGEQPVLAPGTSYDYVSGCPLATSHGEMVGSYEMVGEDGSVFRIAIPRFYLHAPGVMQ